MSEARSNAVELLPDHGPNESGRLNEEAARERDRAREREREDRRERRERDRSRDSHRSHRSRDVRERDDRPRMSREDREAERERRDREMRDERREAARMREERFAEASLILPGIALSRIRSWGLKLTGQMDRERERERRMYSRREERGGPDYPRARRSSPSYDGAPPRREDPARMRERSPPGPEDPASQVFRTIDRETRSVFVSQIAARITSADLGLFFEDKLGPDSVRDARIVTDRLSRRSKG